jgi:hypothetical protein
MSDIKLFKLDSGSMSELSGSACREALHWRHNRLLSGSDLADCPSNVDG